MTPLIVKLGKNWLQLSKNIHQPVSTLVDVGTCHSVNLAETNIFLNSVCLFSVESQLPSSSRKPGVIMSSFTRL